MKKGRSNYSFQLNCDVNIINQMIQSYLMANKFQQTEKNGEMFYKAGDAMIGYRGFSYSFMGQTLNISVWLIGLMNDLQIEQNSLNASAMNYRDSLNALFQQISNLNNRGMNPQYQYQQTNMNNGFIPNQNVGNNLMPNMQNNPNQFVQNFEAETNKKKETMCEVGFWLSIAGLLISFFGITYGVLVYIMNFYFASQGLKTRKKGKAITTIVLSILSIIIFFVMIVLAAVESQK